MTDEIYEHILYDGARHVSIASLPGMKDLTVTINSVSKTYSLTAGASAGQSPPKGSPIQYGRSMTS